MLAVNTYNSQALTKRFPLACHVTTWPHDCPQESVYGRWVLCTCGAQNSGVRQLLFRVKNEMQMYTEVCRTAFGKLPKI